MEIRTVLPGAKSGCVTVPASKSWAHRMLITAALSSDPCEIICDGISKDIEATVKCLNALGADISITVGTEEECNPKDTVIKVRPVVKRVDHSGSTALYSHLSCGESGSTLRFMIPVVGALGINGAFHMEGRLSERPLKPLTEVLTKHGMTFRKDGKVLYCMGQLNGGSFEIPGNISSQYISGLLLALPLLPEDSTLNVTGTIESGDYIEMTVRAIEEAGVKFERKGYAFNIEGKQKYKVPESLTVEKDWSSAAFPLCMGAFSEEGVTVTGLNINSVQGDKEILNILERFGADIRINGTEITVRKGMLKGQVIDASRIPDLVPVISAVAAGAEGETRIIHAERLRIKESDRLATTTAMLKALGADIEETEDGLLINGRGAPAIDGCGTNNDFKLKGGKVDSFNDHRIAMSAAVAAGICENEVVITGAECTDKSFPGFWETIGSMD